MTKITLRDLAAPAPATAGESDGTADAAIHFQAAARRRLSPSVDMIATWPAPSTTAPMTSGAGRMDSDPPRTCRLPFPLPPVVTISFGTAPGSTIADTTTTREEGGRERKAVSTGRPNEAGLR